MEHEVKIQQTEVAIQNDSNYDLQVETAKRFPREIARAVDNMIAIATMDKETAKSCSYSIPRAGKPVTGGSVHMAKIVAQNWGNLRVEARVSKITGTNIYSEAIAFDLETNVAVKVESTRKITKSNGQRYNDDMISLTGLVTNSIALRNAVFAVVPKSVIDKVYKAAMEVITGDISDETKLVANRKKILDEFKNSFGVKEDEILFALGLNTANQIKQDQIVILVGMRQSLLDGEFDVDTMFNRVKKPEDVKTKASDKLFNDSQNSKK
jgi:hypothetical protein